MIDSCGRTIQRSVYVSSQIGDQASRRDHADPDGERYTGQRLDIRRNYAVTRVPVDETANRQRQQNADADQRQLCVVDRNVAGYRRVGSEEDRAGDEIEEESAPENLEQEAKR